MLRNIKKWIGIARSILETTRPYVISLKYFLVSVSSLDQLFKRLKKSSTLDNVWAMTFFAASLSKYEIYAGLMSTCFSATWIRKNLPLKRNLLLLKVFDRTFSLSLSAHSLSLSLYVSLYVYFSLLLYLSVSLSLCSLFLSCS